MGLYNGAPDVALTELPRLAWQTLLAPKALLYALYRLGVLLALALLRFVVLALTYDLETKPADGAAAWLRLTGTLRREVPSRSRSRTEPCARAGSFVQTFITGERDTQIPSNIAYNPPASVISLSVAGLALSWPEQTGLGTTALYAALSYASAVIAGAAARRKRARVAGVASAVELGCTLSGGWGAAGAALCSEVLHRRGAMDAACGPSCAACCHGLG